VGFAAAFPAWRANSTPRSPILQVIPAWRAGVPRFPASRAGPATSTIRWSRCPAPRELERQWLLGRATTDLPADSVLARIPLRACWTSPDRTVVLSCNLVRTLSTLAMHQLSTASATRGGQPQHMVYGRLGAPQHVVVQGLTSGKAGPTIQRPSLGSGSALPEGTRRQRARSGPCPRSDRPATGSDAARAA